MTCGQSITASVTLTGNLGPCSGDGLIAAKAGITINLGGHIITGTNSLPSYGVWDAGVSSVTVTNGIIRNFSYGVVLENSNTSKATNLRLTGNSFGIAVFGGATDTISGNVVWSNSGLGIAVCCGGSKHVLTGNTVQSNPIGIQVGDATATLVSAVTVSGNKVTSNTTDGIRLYPSATGTILTSNVANSNAGNGIRSEDGTAKFTTNTADYNGALGVLAAPGSLDGGGNLGQDNTTVRQCADVVCVPV